MSEEIIGHVIDKKDENTLTLKNLQNEVFEIEIPDIFHYSVGDAVPEGHDYSRKCKQCRNEQMYDSKNDEWYCPLGHDN
jgi:hypothetical protein